MILLTAVEAAESLCITPAKFIRLQDKGRITPEVTPKGVFYDSSKLWGLKLFGAKLKIIKYPSHLYTTPADAMERLGVCRKTFYTRVSKGEIQLYKDGTRSFVKISDLYATDELF